MASKAKNKERKNLEFSYKRKCNLVFENTEALGISGSPGNWTSSLPAPATNRWTPCKGEGNGTKEAEAPLQVPQCRSRTGIQNFIWLEK